MKNGVRFADADFDPHAYAAMDGLFLEDTWNSQFVDEIQPSAGEEILRGRSDFCAFEGTELLSILKRNKIETVIMCGFLSNVCIEETATRAMENIPGLKVVVCSDGCAAKTKEDHDNTMEMSLPVLGCEVMTCVDAEELIRTEQQPLDKDSGEDGSGGRPRILAMHGAKSNDEVTRLQLENLGITDVDYDIVYLKGSIDVEEGDPDIASIIRGPYYSWFEDNKDGKDHSHSILSGVRDILNITQTLGPFDGVYGFSSGAAMAVLSACITADPQLRSAIKALDEGIDVRRLGSMAKRFSTKITKEKRATLSRSQKSQKSMKSHGTKPNRKSRLDGFLSKGENSKRYSKRFDSIDTEDIVEPPFKFVILACAASPFSGVAELRRAAGLPVMKTLELNSYTIPSFHIIGIEDHFKTQSEEVASLFAHRKVMYIPGGHGTCLHVVRYELPYKMHISTMNYIEMISHLKSILIYLFYLLFYILRHRPRTAQGRGSQRPAQGFCEIPWQPLSESKRDKLQAHVRGNEYCSASSRPGGACEAQQVKASLRQRRRLHHRCHAREMASRSSIPP